MNAFSEMERFSLLNMAEDLSRAVVLVSADAKQEKREHQRAEDCQDEPDEGKVADAFQHQGDQGGTPTAVPRLLPNWTLP